MEIILLAGYMGSGKTTVGRILATELGLPFCDLDEYISQQIGISVGEIFARLGEIAFRRAEHENLKALVVGTPQVIALGGGTPCYSGNHLLLRAPGVRSFYLQAGVSALAERLSIEKSERPLIANVRDEDLAGFIGPHLFEREEFYRQAHHIISTDLLSPDAVVQSIVAQLKQA